MKDEAQERLQRLSALCHLGNLAYNPLNHQFLLPAGFLGTLLATVRSQPEPVELQMAWAAIENLCADRRAAEMLA